MIRSRRQNFASLPQALSSDSANTHWNLSATMLSCPWSIWDSFRGIQSHTHNWSFGWITIKIHNKIKYLKVPTYERLLHFLENRRVLCAAWEDEHIHAVIASVEKIRQKLEDLLDEHPHASISPILQNLQECTWQFSDFKSFPPFRIFDKTTHALQFNTSLYNLRGEFIEKLGELGSMTHISMEDLMNRIRESLNTMHWLNSNSPFK